jgi:capsular polysaccharide transport system permease protein
MSYSQELKTIKEKRRKILTYGLGAFVFLPTFVVAFYYCLIASPQYISTTKFNVVVESGGSTNFLASSLGLAFGGSSQTNINEAFIVKEFLKSQDIIHILDKKINLLKIFDHNNADFWAAPPKNPNIEDYLDFYTRMIDVSLNETDGFVTLNVAAFTPKDAQIIAESIMQEAEDFVNKRSSRMQKDSIKFAEKFLMNAEQKVLEANISLSKFRNTNQSFDPTVTAKGVLQITSQLEGELAKTKTEIATLKNYLKSDNPKIQNLEAKKSSLENQIKSQSGRLAAHQGSSLADMTQEYEAHKLMTEFAVKRYATAIVGLEEARAKASQQMKYLLRVTGPTIPEKSTKPEPLKEIFGTFFVTLVMFTIGGLILSALKDHIRS